jgi:hypothetical protein
MSGAVRQPLLWLIVAMSLAVVAASVHTVRTAGRTPATTPDDVQRIAQIQTTDGVRDRRALDLNLRADIELGDAGLRLHSNAIVTGALLQLSVIHATDADQDRRFALVPCGVDLWCADAELPDARFRFEVAPDDASWRIVGARELGQRRITLTSAWSPR